MHGIKALKFADLLYTGGVKNSEHYQKISSTTPFVLMEYDF